MPVKLQKLTAAQLTTIDDTDERQQFYDQVKRQINHGRVASSIKTFSICVDGEGETDEATNIHRYTLLSAGNADGTFYDEVKDPDGLTTQDCFWFIFNLPDNAIKVGFAFNYDINMMLGDIPIRYLIKLHERQYVRWKGWTIGWIPHKSFSLSRQTEKGKRSCTVWDMWSYFQGTFVKAIEKWDVGTDEGRAFIKTMKLKRADFVNEDPQKIKEYCALECAYGAEVFQKVLNYTRSIGLKLRRYDGAGSVASAMLKKHSIDDYMHQKINRLPDEVILSGYHGGRFDITTFGFCGDTFEYDINSAYPYQALHLPCLSCSSWKYTTNYDGNLPWTIWDVSWNLDQSALWSPFIYSDKPGAVQYLRNGRGWYWANEVREALALYPASIQVHRGYSLQQNCDHQPFKFVNEYYELRKELVANGNLAELIVKLGLNSLYGKLAQSIARFGSVPQSQCFIWAGIITSNTRAMLLSSVRANPDDAIVLATDAIIRRTKNDAYETGTELGGWKLELRPDLFIVANGVYQSRAKAQSGHWVIVKEKTRGFAPKFMYPDKGKDHWTRLRELARESDRFNHAITRQDFFGLGNALNNDAAHFDDWRKWITRPHIIKYGKFKDKQIRDGRLYPADNPLGDTPSAPQAPEKYRQDDVPLVWPNHLGVTNDALS